MNLLALTLTAFAVQTLIGCGRSESTAAAENSPTDPLAHHDRTLGGVTLATFDGWEATTTSDARGTTLRAHPRGRGNEFSLVVYVMPMTQRDQATYLDTTPQQFANALPGTTLRGPVRRAALAGYDARLAEYDVTGRALAAMLPHAPAPSCPARAAYLQKDDLGVMVFAVGTEDALRDLGSAVDTVAQSLRSTESSIDGALVGTWYTAGSTSAGRGSGMMSLTWERTTTFHPDGTFIETDLTIGSTGGGGLSGNHAKSGHAIRRGDTLTFHYTDGSVRQSDYSVSGSLLQLHGKRWTRQ